MGVLLTVGITCLGASASALNISTHRLVNRLAAQTPAGFNEFLNNGLGLSGGLAAGLTHGGTRATIQDWLEEGGEREDDVLRFLRHFHDPLKPWESAGLDLWVDRHDSSVRWMQQTHQGGVSTGGFWSWRDARRLYYDALTEPDPVRREAIWADVFRALGQIMHLVVDASVPEHARNDIHPLGGMTRLGSYEYWVSRQHELPTQEAQFVARYLSAPIGFIEDILQLPPPAGEGIATAPVARLIDADRYDGTNADVTVGGDDVRAPVAAGLAEIASANFFSEDTLRGQYPSPTDAGLIPVNLATPNGRVRRYWSRPPGLGLLPANPVRAECAAEGLYVRGVTVQPPPYPCTDQAVWSQVAAHMLPRAVGYARGVLDYFFRGSATVTGIQWTRNGIDVSVRNTGTEEMEGVFEIHARHQAGTAAERRVRLATLGEGEPVFLAPGDEWTFQNAMTVPPDADPTATHVLVFRGRLGLEQDAVVGQIFTVPYVEVRQTIYDADVAPSCNRPPATGSSPPYAKGVTVTIKSESMRCEWRIVTHRVGGTLRTNMPIDPVTHRSEPVIDRIEAQWIGGDRRGPAPLVLDGRPVGSVWQREGTEPDPTTYAVVDPTDRSRSYLYLLVSYRGNGQIEAHQAIFTWGVSSHTKQVVLDNRVPSAPQYLVTSGRGVSGQLAYNWTIEGQMLRPLFEAVSHGRVPVPMDTRTERRFGGGRVFKEGRATTATTYVDDAIDDFEALADGDAAFNRLSGIEPLMSPHPAGPFYAWAAEVRRVYQTAEREFLRAFVTVNPEPFVVTLTGTVLGE